MPGNLILLGYRGAGKSTVGRAVAAELGWPFVDTDDRIVAIAGRSIRELFAAGGEAGFRLLESEVIAEVTHASGQVISVGGGAVLSPDNRARLRAAGTCIWLTAAPEELHRRLTADPQTSATRPALTARTPLEEIRHLLAERGPLYADLAAHRVATEGRSVAELAAAILALVPGRPTD